MKKIFLSFRRNERGLLAVALPLLCAVVLVAQPSSMFINQDVSNTYTNTTMTSKGGSFQARFQEGTGQTTGTRNWQFNSDGYSNTWGARTAATLTSYNSVISPSTTTASANWANSCSPSCYNAFGKLPATTTNYYYTYNILKGSSYASQTMAVLETSYNPNALTVTHTAGTKTVTLGSGLATGEYLYVRSSTDNFTTSCICQLAMTGTTGTFGVVNNTCSYYFYSSNQTLTAINAAVTTYGQSAHDLFMLNLATNGGSNYTTTATLPVKVTSTTGTTSLYYETLGAAFSAINFGVHSGTLSVSILGDVTETTTATLKASGSTGGSVASSYSTISIQPLGGAARTITGAITAPSPLIDLNGADNVTVDGLNTGGNTLTISNTTASATSGTSTIRFIDGATTNTLTNCTVLGSFAGSAATNGGTIFFSTDAVATGNDNNTVSNCTIGPAGANLPTKGIFGRGTPTANNNGITISNNNIYDFFGLDVTSAGIYIYLSNTDWTISNNKFYQTATRTQTTGSQHSALWIANGTSGNNFSITGNTIGYSTSNGTGSYTLIGVSGTSFVPIYLNLASTGTASSVQNNTIVSIAMSGAQAGTNTSGPIIGIQVKDGLVNIGEIIGNTIGSTSAIGNITYTSSATTRSDISGIYVESSSTTMIIANNTIGGITVANSSTGASNIYGIKLSTSGAVTCQNNTIGGTVANSLQSTSTSTSTAINGIYNNGVAATISANTIRNIATAGGTKTADLASVIGISSVATTANTISQNTMYNLSNSLVGATVVTGIYIGDGTVNTVSRNNIHSLTAASTSTTSTLNGINTDFGTTTYSNNIIRLGIDGAGTSTTTGMTINGIYDQGGTNSFYYNTVYVGGNSVTGSAATYAFTGVGSATRVYQNNIFQNARSNAGGGTGKHYAIKIASATNLTINNNLYFANGTGGVLANFNGTDKTDITAWRTSTSQDANSINVAPVFSYPTGDATAVNLHLTTGSSNNCSIKGIGATGTGITVDYDGDTRSTTQPGIGADEFGVKVAVTTISGTTPACASTVLTPTTTPTSGLTYTWGNPTTPIGSATSSTYSVTATGSYNVTITETSSGCTGSAVSASAITINPLPTITLGSTPSVCRGITAANLPYSATTNSPNQYSITYNAAAITAGFANLSNTTLPTTPIVLTIPAAATAATYNATLTVTNATTGCISAASNITATVNALPTIAFTQVNDPCQISAGSITVTITGGAPTYSIAACGTTIAPSPTVGQYIGVTGSPATVATSGGATTFSNLQGNATYKLTVTDNNGCIGQ